MPTTTGRGCGRYPDKNGLSAHRIRPVSMLDAVDADAANEDEA